MAKSVSKRASTRKPAKPKLRIAMAQISAKVGDVELNSRQILRAMQTAAESGCDLIVFPELTLFGYPAFDLLEQPGAVDRCEHALRQLHQQMPEGLTALVGTLRDRRRPASGTSPNSKQAKPVAKNFAEKNLLNSAVLLSRGRKLQVFDKVRLPNYDVFDDARHFRSGFDVKRKSRTSVQSQYTDYFRNSRFSLRGLKIQVTICEDIWGWDHADNELVHAPNRGRDQVDLVVNLSASPYSSDKALQRSAVLKKTAKHFRAPVFYCNTVGGQDEILFDGDSRFVAANGETIGAAPQFEEVLTVVEVEQNKKGAWTVSRSVEHRNLYAAQSPKEKRSRPNLSLSQPSELRKALVMGLRDFLAKTNQSKVILGLSGGIDSAVVCCLAAEALGTKQVLGVALPGPFSAPDSLAFAKEQAERMQIEFRSWSIVDMYNSMVQQLQKDSGPIQFDVALENLQARLRAVVLMLFSNLEHRILLSTSNKSKLATGYSTLYGDQCGGIAPLGDCLKQQVYALAREYHQLGWIDQRVIDRAPTAELRQNQKDQDSLPPYDQLDSSVVRIVEQCLPPQNAIDHFVLSSLKRTEFKRWQAPPILRISNHAFGRGRRHPIART